MSDNMLMTALEESKARIAELECEVRLRRQEHLETCRAVDVAKAEVERLRKDYLGEVTEFNAGWEAAKRGELDIAPDDAEYDTWSCGWAWFKCSDFERERDEARAEADMAAMTIDTWQTQLAEARELLRKLTCEVAALFAWDAELRDLIGNTNAEALIYHAENAKAHLGEGER